MADQIVSPGASAPPLDTVLLWVTTTIEQDYEQRGAFPALRHAHAKDFHGGATLHYLSADEANRVLEDANARMASARGGTMTAYRAHIKSLELAIKEAAERPVIFGSCAAFCAHKDDRGERWLGTKVQFEGLGIRLAGPWPREPGGNARWAPTTDSRGYKVSITRLSAVFPGLFMANIVLPADERGPGAGQADLSGQYDQFARDARRAMVDEPRPTGRSLAHAEVIDFQAARRDVRPGHWARIVGGPNDGRVVLVTSGIGCQGRVEVRPIGMRQLVARHADGSLGPLSGPSADIDLHHLERVARRY